MTTRGSRFHKLTFGAVAMLVLGIGVVATTGSSWPILVDPGPQGYDAGIFEYCGRALRASGALYHVCVDQKPPVVFLINALGSALPTVNGAQEFAMVLLGQLVGWSLIGVVLLRTVGTVVALLTVSSLVPATVHILEAGNTVEAFSLIFQAAILLATVQFSKARNPAPALLGLAIGSLAAFLVLLRPNHFGVLVVPLLVLARCSDPTKSLLKFIGFATFAGSMTMLALILLAGGNTAIPDFARYVLEYGVAYSRLEGGGRLFAAISISLNAVAPLAPVALAASFFAYAGTPVRESVKKSPTKEGIPVYAVIAWLVMEIALASVSGRRYPHYSFMLVAPIALLLGRIWHDAVRRGTTSGQAEIASYPSRQTLGALVFAIVVPLQLLPTLKWKLEDVRSGVSYSANALRIADSLRTLGADTSGVFVWADGPAINAILNSASPTRYVVQLALGTRGFTTEAMVQEFHECLRGASPRFIVEGRQNSSTPLLKNGDPTTGFFQEVVSLDGVRSWIFENYEMIGVVGPWRYRLWRRNEITLQPASEQGNTAPVDCRPRPGQWSLD